MAFTHYVTRGYRTAAGTITSVTDSQSASGEVSIDESVTTGSEPTLTCAIDVSALKSIMLHSDKAVTLKFNDDGTPTDTIALAAGQIIVWQTGDVESCPLTEDTLAVDVVNDSGSTARVRIYALQDATP